MADTEKSFDKALFPKGVPKSNDDLDLAVDLYKLMVASSENLVARRQGVNTFFLTVNGAILTASGLIIANQDHVKLQAIGLVLLTVTGAVLALAWLSLIKSFGQLNAGKFAVINKIESILPVAVYSAEWAALGEGKAPRKYRTFTSREVWTPWTFFVIYCVATVLSLLVAFGRLEL